MSGAPHDFGRIASRLGPALLRKRLHRQANIAARLIHQGEGALAVERVIPVDRIIERTLKFSGLGLRGRANCLDIRVVKRDQPLANLPPVFDGFRLLHISDLHLDLIPGFADVVIGLIRGIPHDQAVITGDFADHPAGYFHDCLGDIFRIAEALSPQPIAILGNHDIIEIVPHLEAAGLRVLLNENTRLEHAGQHLWFAGIDDPCFYRTHDLEAAHRGIPAGDCSILLSHSPETYDGARHCGFSFMLSGHTHGGQICLPGGTALVRNGRCPAAQFAGAWSHHGLHGYTSRGTGSCGVAARFNCPPEMTLHILRRP
ncbi:MAG: metallophosphoesterase family protein [Chthoniobacterales bacterium]|nr:metallophosphoesterase family protein [Chthoniobacterales bacterium]